MRLLTEEAKLVCDHRLGNVKNEMTQDWVTIDGRIVMIEDDPVGEKISGCPNINLGIKPCQLTLTVKEGYSDLLRIDGNRVCLDTLQGLTDGTPPGIVVYRVIEAGQDFVGEME
ncbi:MAG: hypothetical protein JWP89_1818 [Schlesneria sp.]|nr:hypothetical protein [Schlesneria sp.]